MLKAVTRGIISGILITIISLTVRDIEIYGLIQNGSGMAKCYSFCYSA